jgi:hypothetical protein
MQPQIVRHVRLALITRDLRAAMSRWAPPPSDPMCAAVKLLNIHGPGRPFAKGNPGRRRGSTNRRSATSAALLAGEEQELLDRAVELAKAGDTHMRKFLPRDRALKVELPKMEYADDAVEALCAIAPAQRCQVRPPVSYHFSGLAARGT